MFRTSHQRFRFKLCVLFITAWACVCLLAAPTLLRAQTSSSSDDAQVSCNGSDATRVYSWQDVPKGQQVSVCCVTFDQGGYQITAQTGGTIVVPFVNQNLYALRFGHSTSGQPYFVNEGDAPSLYVPANFSLASSANATARWTPLPASYTDSQPVYISPVPSWSDYVAMNWYAGMNWYGGLWGYSPRSVVWIPNTYILINGRRFTTYNSYVAYYTNTPGFRLTPPPVNGRASGTPNPPASGNGRRAGGSNPSAPLNGRGAGVINLPNQPKRPPIRRKRRPDAPPVR